MKRVFGGDLTHVGRSVLFCNLFSKSDSKSGTVHAGVDAVEQARTCAGSSRRPCCKSLKAGCTSILKNNTKI